MVESVARRVVERQEGHRRFYAAYDGFIPCQAAPTHPPDILARRSPYCRAPNGQGFVCTRPPDHSGAHIGHRQGGEICPDGIWDDFTAELAVNDGL